MEVWLPIVLQLVGGAVGGNATGGGAKRSLGTTLTAVLGALGGVGGGQLLDALGVGGAATLDVASLASDLIGGGAGGAIVGAVASIASGGRRA